MRQKYLSLLILVFGTFSVFAANGTGDHEKKRGRVYSPDKAEFYFDTKKADYVRPGLNITVLSIEIPADLRPVVELMITDDRGQPLDRAGNVTPGSIAISFIMAVYDGEARHYTAYTTRPQTSPITNVTENQASTDSGGSWTDHDVGWASYRFGTALPANYAANKTHTLALYATRNLTEILDKNYYDNVLHDFRPDGGALEEVWEATYTETCNNCHDPLALHGGSRREVKLCVTCHNPQSVDPDTGNSVDMKVMIHKIHMGEELPSVQAGTPYQIIGFRQSVHDYSEVVFPQDNRNCTTCHPSASPESHIWYSRPSRAACGSCHDLVNWETGEGHTAGPALDDSECASCHQPQGEAEFDASVTGAHTIAEKSAQLAGLAAEILDVSDTAPGQNPTVTFRLSNSDGSAVAPSELSTLNLMLAGPNSEYAEFIRENATGAQFDGDIASYTFSNPIPDHAEGSWSATGDIYRNAVIHDAEGGEISVREAAFNPLRDFAVTDAVAGSRRQVVSLDKCNNCHETLSLHGGQRFAIDECVMCHNPEGDDSPVRPPDTGPPESIHFKYMIHRIHRGEELEADYTVYGFRSSVHNYSHVLFPGDLRNCESCHLAGTYGAPAPEEARATVTLRDFYSPMEPLAAACLSCHDSADAAAHAYVNTAPFAESCAACHGADREFSVERVHAR
jgi:OmcA/MtrC family decaheme c-type cytochrome